LRGTIHLSAAHCSAMLPHHIASRLTAPYSTMLYLAVPYCAMRCHAHSMHMLHHCRDLCVTPCSGLQRPAAAHGTVFILTRLHCAVPRRRDCATPRLGLDPRSKETNAWRVGTYACSASACTNGPTVQRRTPTGGAVIPGHVDRGPVHRTSPCQLASTRFHASRTTALMINAQKMNGVLIKRLRAEETEHDRPSASSNKRNRTRMQCLRTYHWQAATASPAHTQLKLGEQPGSGACRNALNSHGAFDASRNALTLERR
jgi:hypothetical protein